MYTEKAICDLGVELYNMLKWLSEGSNRFRKIPISVKVRIIYDEFALIGRAI